MSANPRNPTYFPKMKVRGRTRRLIAPYQRAVRGFMLLGMAAEKAAYHVRRFRLVMTEEDLAR